MQKISLLLCLLILTSCGKNPLSPAAMISFNAGGTTNALQTNSFVSSSYKINLVADPQQFTVTIDKIEISTNGETWETILNAPTEFQVNGNDINTVEISKGIPIAEDEYHGIRVWISRVKWQDQIVTISRLYKSIQLGQGTLYYSFNNPIEFSTKNGFLNSFKTVREKEIYIVFNLALYYKPSEDIFALDMAVRTTRFQ